MENFLKSLHLSPVQEECVVNFSNIPSVTHWAIITQVSVHIPGDERSRLSPGHGYPESTEYYISYESFMDEIEWKAKIAYLAAHGTVFRAMHVHPASIKTEVKVIVDEDKPIPW